MGSPPPPRFPNGYELKEPVRYDSCLKNQMISWYDSDGNRRSIRCGVEGWKYRLLTPNSKDAAQEISKLFLSRSKDNFSGPSTISSSGKTLGTGKGLTTLEFKESETSTLFVELEESHKYLKVSVYRRQSIEPGQSICLNFSKFRDYLSFYTESDGKNFGTLNFDFKTPQIALVGRREDEFGELRQTTNFIHTLSQGHGPHHEIYSIPQLPGKTLYTLRNNNKNTKGYGPVNISFTNTLPIKKIPQVDIQGGLIVKKATWGRATVENEFYDDVYSPLFSKGSKFADRTPEGYDLFWLPPGYWKVTVLPRKGQIVRDVQCHMVPVYGGKITTVSFPASLAPAFATANEGHIEISQINGTNSRSTINISIVDNKIEGLIPSIKNTTVKVFILIL